MRILRSLIATTALLWLAIHCLLSGLYHAPTSPLRQSAEPLIHAYMVPSLLEQRFSMFAPEPSTASFRFLYRYQSAGGEWSDWRDVGAGLLVEHQTNRFTCAGHLLWLHQGIARCLLLRAAQIEEDLPPELRGPQRQAEGTRRLQASQEFALAKRYFGDLARRDAAQKGEGPPQQLEFMHMSISCVPFSKRRNPTASPKVSSVRFPPALLTEKP